MNHLPFHCKDCGQKSVITRTAAAPSWAAAVVGVCLKCLSKTGGASKPLDESYISQEQYERLDARQNPNQLSLL